MKPTIGKITGTGKGLALDLPRLLKTRALFQANSGGGKSWVIRRMLEQTANRVQQIVLDIEGDFITLREKFDYVIGARQGADAVATPHTAAILARRLRETRVSAIIDLYELKMPERKRFVRLFLEELMETPKSMWHPALIVVDEAHLFCPEKGEAESAAAVIDIATRGRKRGLCAVLATQRLSKLHKDTAAELLNKLIGRTALDLDVKRAAEELGMTPKEAFPVLRNLGEGEFFCFGPALSREVTKVKVGPVITTHPEAGVGQITAPPAPSNKIKSLLAKLTDLPKEAEQEARSLADFKRENAQLKRELTVTKKAQPSAAPTKIERIEVPIVGKMAYTGIKEAATQMRKALAKIRKIHEAWAHNLSLVDGRLAKLTETLEQVHQKSPPTAQQSQPVIAVTRTPLPSPPPDGNGAAPVDNLSGAARKILAVLSQFPEGCNAGKLTLLTGYRYQGGFKNSLSELRTAGLIVGANTGIMRITTDGLACGPFDPLPQGRDLIHYWRHHRSFGACERKILTALIHEPDGLDAPTLCEKTGYRYSGGFKNSLSKLRTAGVITGPNTGVMRASDELLIAAIQ